METQLKPLHEQNLKIRIQILDSDDNILISSVISQMYAHNCEIYTGVSAVNESYHILLNELTKKQAAEK
jgi:hypothetical protein